MKRRKSGWALAGMVFEVDADPGETVAVDIGHQLLDGAGARRRIGQHAAQLVALPFLTAPVVDQGHDRKVGAAVADVLGHLRRPVGVVLANRAVLAGEVQPFGDQQIQAVPRFSLRELMLASSQLTKNPMVSGCPGSAVHLWGSASRCCRLRSFSLRQLGFGIAQGAFAARGT